MCVSKQIYTNQTKDMMNETEGVCYVFCDIDKYEKIANYNLIVKSI